MNAYARGVCLLFLAVVAPMAARAYTVITTSTGAPIKWPAPKESVLLNASAGPSGADAALQSALNTWSAVPGSTFRFCYAGASTISNATYDGNNVCSFSYLGTDGTVARNSTIYYTSTGQLLDSDIVFNTCYSWSATGAAGKFDVQNVATHELGHALSLADLYGAGDAEKTMYGYVNTGETKKQTLDPDDVAGIAHLYPLLPAVTLGLTGSPMAEAGGVAIVTATLSAAAPQAVTVTLSFSGTATLTGDYTPSTTSIVIPAGSLSGSTALTAAQDTLQEGDESVVVDIGSVSNGTENVTQQVAATISDDDYVPTIITQPVPQTVPVAGTATFAVGIAAGGPSVFYQWRFNGEPIGGATNGVCTLVNVQATQAGQYSVRITNAYGTATSMSALLTVENALDHYAWSAVSTTQTIGIPFNVSVSARDVYDNLLTSCTNRLVISGAGNHGPVSLQLESSAALAAGQWTGSIRVSTADSAVRLAANDGNGHASQSQPFEVSTGPVDHFAWAPIPPQHAAAPFPVSLTAQDAGNNTVTGYTGVVALTGLQRNPTNTSNILGDLPTPLFSSGSYTLGYSFTPADNITVTHLRHYFGTKVSIWTDTGVCLATQNVSSVPGTWTETPLSTPVHLTAGIRYRVGVFTSGGSYFRMDGATAFSHGVIHQSLNASGDACPASADSARWWFVDLRFNLDSDKRVAIAPASAGTFVSGVWTGMVTVQEAVTNLCLAADDGAGHTGTSSMFNIEPDDIPPTLNNIMATPALAKSGTEVTLTFTASEPLSAATVAVNTHAASFVNRSGDTYTYRYTILDSDANGAATIAITGTDLAGNPGSASSTTALSVNNIAPMGTPDMWLIQNGLTSDAPATEEMKDTDGDGMTAWQEYVAGTQPTNSASVFRCVIALSNGTSRVTWSPDLGTSRVYTVEGRTSLAEGAWGVTNAESRFFRVRVALP